MPNDQVIPGGLITAAKANDITIGTNAPSTPTTGWLWIDTGSTPALLKVYNGSAWVLAMFGSATPAAVPFNGSAGTGTANYAARVDHVHPGPHIEAKSVTGTSGYGVANWTAAFSAAPIVTVQNTYNEATSPSVYPVFASTYSRSTTGALLIGWLMQSVTQNVGAQTAYQTANFNVIACGAT